MKRQGFAGAAFLVALLITLGIAGAVPTSQTPETDEPVTPRQRITAHRVGGRTMQALYQVEALAHVEGWGPDLLEMAGELWLDVGDWPTAAAFWEAALQAQPDNVGLRRDLARTYLELERWSQAADSFTEIIQRDSAGGWEHFQLALIRAPFDPAFARSHLAIAAADPVYRASAESLLVALGEESEGDLIAMRVGFELMNQERWPQAELAFQHAAVLNPRFVEALAFTGFARDQQGKDGGPWIEQAVALGPQNAQARYLQGLHLRALGEEAASLDALIQAVALSPDDAALYAELGVGYRRVGDLEQAEHWLRTAVTISNNDPELQGLLALFYAEEGYNLEGGSLDELETIAEAQPENADVRAAFGWALHQVGCTEDGLAHLDIALTSSPNNLRAQYYKARILYEQDEVEAALRLFERVAEVASPFQEDSLRVLRNEGR